LLRAPNDTGLPIELLTRDGRRVAHVGNYLPGDTVSNLAPELRPLSGAKISHVPADPPGLDTIANGALYTASGRVYSWAVIPVKRDSARLGYIALQRRLIAA